MDVLYARELTNWVVGGRYFRVLVGVGWDFRRSSYFNCWFLRVFRIFISYKLQFELSDELKPSWKLVLILGFVLIVESNFFYVYCSAQPHLFEKFEHKKPIKLFEDQKALWSVKLLYGVQNRALWSVQKPLWSVTMYSMECHSFSMECLWSAT